MTYYMGRIPGNHFFHSVDVLGCLDYQELGALTETQQEIVKFIISAGFVDPSEGSKSRQKLENFFPEGTETRTALEALMIVNKGPWERGE